MATFELLECYAHGMEDEIMSLLPFIHAGGLHGDANRTSGSLEYACARSSAQVVINA